MISERDDPFYDLGYTTPEEALELRRAREEKAGRKVTSKTVGGESAKRSRRARAATGPQYGEESHVGYPEGRPEDQPYRPLSQEQADRNRHFAKNWKEIAAEAIRNDTHAVEDD